ncbi:hypothetical protein RND71_008061 [Anisodus tanguticus]|uniref:Uncharacterized protein n=1 Tax=Anisodus tanguticus TaxID=243964 RepID=A0AAE1QSU5_9SOLA|nr:hypothetical protein RND71_043814 [Anisodus tanguticus]KAK4372677.1 hypothetical protein RND71_008061 [Anisodus tanguticus]
MPVLLADGPSLTSLESTMPLFPSRKLLAVPGSRRFDLLGWVLCLLIPLLNHPSFH